jgi:hypothetical protein
MKAILTGFTETEIIEMIEEKYGSCAWGFFEDNKEIGIGKRYAEAFPTGIGKVIIYDE